MFAIMLTQKTTYQLVNNCMLSVLNAHQFH